MRKRIFCLLVLLAAPAQAQDGSNIGLTDYPGPSCSKPQTPPTPPDVPRQTTDAAAVDGYNAKVKKYNADIAAYNAAVASFNACMHIYVENGNSDMKRIKQKLDEAVAAASAH